MHRDQEGEKSLQIVSVLPLPCKQAITAAVAGTVQEEREKKGGLRDQGGLQIVSVMLP